MGPVGTLKADTLPFTERGGTDMLKERGGDGRSGEGIRRSASEVAAE